jgi:hypothetical protein
MSLEASTVAGEGTGLQCDDSLKLEIEWRTFASDRTDEKCMACRCDEARNEVLFTLDSEPIDDATLFLCDQCQKFASKEVLRKFWKQNILTYRDVVDECYKTVRFVNALMNEGDERSIEVSHVHENG